MSNNRGPWDGLYFVCVLNAVGFALLGLINPWGTEISMLRRFAFAAIMAFIAIGVRPHGHPRENT